MDENQPILDEETKDLKEQEPETTITNDSMDKMVDTAVGVNKPSKFKVWLQHYYAKREAAGKPLTPIQKIKQKQEKKRELEDAETDPKKIKRIKAKREIFQAIKYFIIAGSAGAIQVGTYALFHDAMKLVPWLSHLISLILSVLWNFTFNRKFTFKSAVNVPKAMVKVALYYAVFTPLSMFWTGAFTTGIWGVKGLGIHPWAVEIPTLLINGITEFLYQKFFVFNDAKEKEKATKKRQKENSETCE
ncbi:MAG TPA: GtrA family protein [Clostridia bacterium]|jgi:putative flippase GtrA|nr:GtrA family protein [Clostridia bacterium]